MNQFYVTKKRLGKMSLSLASFALLGFMTSEPRDVAAHDRNSIVRDGRGQDTRKYDRGRRGAESKKDHRTKNRGYNAELDELYYTLDRIERINYSRRPGNAKERKIDKVVHRTRERLDRRPVRDYPTRYEFRMALRKIERVNYSGRPGSTKKRRITRIIHQTRERLDWMSVHSHRARRAYRITSGRAEPLR